MKKIKPKQAEYSALNSYIQQISVINDKIQGHLSDVPPKDTVVQNYDVIDSSDVEDRIDVLAVAVLRHMK